MFRQALFPGTRQYAVEVSGWDTTQNFFVEKCELVWNEESGKQVALRRALRDNAILFVRLLQAGEGDRAHPVVYEAELVGRTQSGLRQFRLNTVAPRVREQESTMA
jgi:hypothetical protein